MILSTPIKVIQHISEMCGRSEFRSQSIAQMENYGFVATSSGRPGITTFLGHSLHAMYHTKLTCSIFIPLDERIAHC